MAFDELNCENSLEVEFEELIYDRTMATFTCTSFPSEAMPKQIIWPYKRKKTYELLDIYGFRSNIIFNNANGSISFIYEFIYYHKDAPTDFSIDLLKKLVNRSVELYPDSLDLEMIVAK